MTIFVDSNIPMYLVGADHPHKRDAQAQLEIALGGRERLVTDVEVLQEILHRYCAIGRRDAIQPAFEALLAIVDEVFGVEVKDVEQAKAIILGDLRLSARDALHLAVMQRHDVGTIMSFDRDFDGYPGVRRIP